MRSRKSIGIAVVLILMLIVLSVSVYAADGEEIITGGTEATQLMASGTCGDNVTWKLSNGVLTLSGYGDMKDYSTASEVPWNSRQS